MNYLCAFGGKKIVLGYFHYHHMIEYFRLNIEYLRFAYLRAGSRRINYNKTINEPLAASRGV